MNKLFYKLMLLVAVLSAGLPVCAASFTTGGLSYNIISASGRTVEVTKNTYYQGDIVIPPSVSYGGKSYKVVAIGDMAFNDNKDVTSLVIPSSVDTIKYCAFGGCSGIKTITIKSISTNRCHFIRDSYARQAVTAIKSMIINPR